MFVCLFVFSYRDSRGVPNHVEGVIAPNEGRAPSYNRISSMHFPQVPGVLAENIYESSDLPPERLRARSIQLTASQEDLATQLAKEAVGLQIRADRHRQNGTQSVYDNNLAFDDSMDREVSCFLHFV